MAPHRLLVVGLCACIDVLAAVDAEHEAYLAKRKALFDNGNLYAFFNTDYTMDKPPSEGQLGVMETEAKDKLHPELCNDHKKKQKWFRDRCESEHLDLDQVLRTLQNETALAKYKETKQLREFDEDFLDFWFLYWKGRRPQGVVSIESKDGLRFITEGEQIGCNGNALSSESSAVEITAPIYKEQLQAKVRKEKWLVMYYKPNTANCSTTVSEFEKAAEEMDGIANIGGVNCLNQRTICEDEKQAGADMIPGPYPRFVWYDANKDDQPQRFMGSVEAQRLSERLQRWLGGKQKGFSTTLHDKSNMRRWLDRNALPKVVLMIHEGDSPFYWRSLSEKHDGKLSFATLPDCGLIHKSDMTIGNELEKEFKKVKRYPAIIHIDTSGEVGAIKTKFAAPFSRANVDKWLQGILGESADKKEL